MATKKTKKSSGMSKTAMTLGAGLVAATAAGAYFLFGTQEGKKTQKKMRGWMVKAKGDVMDKIEDMKEMTEEGYYEMIEKVIAKYKKLKKVEEAEADMLAKDLKKHWKNIKKELSAPKTPAKKK